MSSIREAQIRAFRVAHDTKTEVVGAPPKPIVLPFIDDSTLIFALRMREAFRIIPNAPPLLMAWLVDGSALSYRQMTQLLPEGPDRAFRNKELADLFSSGEAAAIVVSRVYPPLRDALKKTVLRHKGGRACVIAFLGGLDFFPETGFERRRNCDGVYLFPRSEIPRFDALREAYDTGWQEIGFGHPSFIRSDQTAPDLSKRQDVYFFTQALSPSTRRGRLHMLNVMAALARAYPDRTVWIVRRQTFPDIKSIFITEALVRFLFEFRRRRLGAATCVSGLSVS